MVSGLITIPGGPHNILTDFGPKVAMAMMDNLRLVAVLSPVGAYQSHVGLFPLLCDDRQHVVVSFPHCTGSGTYCTQKFTQGHIRL